MSGGATGQGEAAQTHAPQPKRRAKREAVLKEAKIIAGATDAVIECQIQDESPLGVLAVVDAPLALPDRVTIQLASGALIQAARRWKSDTKIGFEFVEVPPDAEPSRQQIRHVRSVLETKGVHEAIYVMRASRFFNSDALRHAAEEVEAAQLRLEALLK